MTNGVHVPTWDSAAADELWTQACGKDRWLGTTEDLEQGIRRVPDESLWSSRTRRSRGADRIRARAIIPTTDCLTGASPEAVETREASVRPESV